MTWGPFPQEGKSRRRLWAPGEGGRRRGCGQMLSLFRAQKLQKQKRRCWQQRRLLLLSACALRIPLQQTGPWAGRQRGRGRGSMVGVGRGV